MLPLTRSPSVFLQTKLGKMLTVLSPKIGPTSFKRMSRLKTKMEV